jgi:adenylate cyclase
LGEIHSWKKEYAQAIGAIETAISLDPNNAENYAALSTALIWVGRLDEAVARMETAMRLNPYHPAMYPFGLGLAQFLSQKHEEAISSLRKVLTRAPDFLWAHVVLALALAQTDRLKEARAEVSEALRINPSFSPETLTDMVPLRDRAALEAAVALLHKVGMAE